MVRTISAHFAPVCYCDVLHSIAGTNGLKLNGARGEARVSVKCMELINKNDLVIPCRCIKLLDLVGKGDIAIRACACLKAWYYAILTVLIR